MTTNVLNQEVGPKPNAPPRGKSWPLPMALIFAALAPLLGGLILIGGWAWWQFGSASAAAAYLSGEALRIEPQAFDWGTVAPLEARTLTIEVSNLSASPITLHGMLGFCGPDGCVTPSDRFPLDLAPRRSRALTIQVRSPSSGGPMKLVTELYTSVGNREITTIGEVGETDTSAHP